jgi:hypothetical protein
MLSDKCNFFCFAPGELTQARPGVILPRKPNVRRVHVVLRRCVAALIILCLMQSNVGAQAKPLELRWNELSQMILNQTVELKVGESATIRGDVASVRDDSLVLDVSKSSDTKAFPKGNASIPRASVTLIKVMRSHGNWGRNLGTTVGVLSGVTIGGYTAGTTADSAGTGIPVFLAIASGISIVGYYLGKTLDRKVTMIRIVP